VLVMVVRAVAVVVGLVPAQASAALSWGAPALIRPGPPYASPNAFSAVSCPSTSLCVAFDQAGNVVTSTRPTEGFSSWRVTNVERSAGLFGLGAFSCPSVALCVGVDGGGNVLTSTRPAGGSGAWTVTPRVDVIPSASSVGSRRSERFPVFRARRCRCALLLTGWGM
jgi:hypothetical protein